MDWLIDWLSWLTGHAVGRCTGSIWAYSTWRSLQVRACDHQSSWLFTPHAKHGRRSWLRPNHRITPVETIHCREKSQSSTWDVILCWTARRVLCCTIAVSRSRRVRDVWHRIRSIQLIINQSVWLFSTIDPAARISLWTPKKTNWYYTSYIQCSSQTTHAAVNPQG